MAPLLPLELLALQLESFDLAQSLFPLPGELELEEETAVILPSLRRWITEGHTPYGGDMEVGRDDVLPTNDIAFTVTLEVTSAANPASIHTLVLAIRLPLTKPLDFAHTLADGSPAATIRLQQPPWMSRTTHDGLAASLPSCNPSTFTSNTDLLLHTIDFLRDKVASVIPLSSEPTPTDTPTKADEPEFRVWLWFPSLSTREKRDDIVNWAPEYGLTGFVLAGKPALLCLEGTESNVQTYLAEIKAKSWADIPSFQKKISERYRTPLLPSSTPSTDPTAHRIFTTMDEITSLIPRTGQRGNRGEMGEVRDFLETKGLGEAFGLVIGGGQF
ncbi:hypothetical protein NBRC10512_000620 [Rhodotorula toruloides]|uniref:RHTO0S01e05732g1_1 n=2 Tax=Rhodotorula toruloides TaxID=5286 RepID=A0A061ADV8_RHOTO|nr:DUF1115 domain protein [Rhodotorula toruloides NP11]EMS21786.1 DUF1115 domain protein [Rhodotorula toruloides NP11]KAJ8292250.1 RWD domain-containing protein 2B [Rhodotorula toruloides]CDR35725.1 RHTO0S01e05732g1_1 [Rhodotorula toruloides]